MPFGALIDSTLTSMNGPDIRVLLERDGYSGTTYSPELQTQELKSGDAEDTLIRHRVSVLAKVVTTVTDPTLTQELRKIPQQAPRNHRLTVEKGGSTHFKGWCKPGATTTPRSDNDPNTATIRAKDNLKGLGADWLDSNGDPFVQTVTTYGEIISGILSHLELSLPIQVVMGWRPHTMGATDDPMQMKPPVRAFYRSDSGANTRPASRGEVLDSLLKSWGCELLQVDGVWKITQPSAFAGGSNVKVWEYDNMATLQTTSTRPTTVTITTEDWERGSDEVGGFRKARDVRVIYDHSSDIDFPLNGSFEERDGDAPEGWLFYENTVQRSFPDPPLFDNVPEEEVIDGDYGVRIEGQKTDPSTAESDLYTYANDWAEKRLTGEAFAARRRQWTPGTEDMVVHIQATFTITDSGGDADRAKIYWGLRGENTQSGDTYYYDHDQGLWITSSNVTEKQRKNAIDLGDPSNATSSLDDIDPVDESLVVSAPPEGVDPWLEIYQIVSLPSSSDTEQYGFAVNYDALEFQRRANAEQPLTTYRAFDQASEEGEVLSENIRVGDGPWAGTQGAILDNDTASHNTDGWQVLGETGTYPHSRLLAREWFRLRADPREITRFSLIRPTNVPQTDRALEYDGTRYWPVMVREQHPSGHYEVHMVELDRGPAPPDYEIRPGDGETVASETANPGGNGGTSATGGEGATSWAAVTNKPFSTLDDTTVENDGGGTLQVADGGIDTAQLASDAVTESQIDASDSPSDGEVLGYNGSALEWQAVSNVSVDVDGDDTDEIGTLTGVTVNGDANDIFTKPAAGELAIAVGNKWPNADQLDGYEGSEVAIRAENESITGQWSFGPTQIFDQGLEDDTFSAGLLAGDGFAAYEDSNGRHVMEADVLRARDYIEALEFIVQKVRATGGSIFVSAGYMKVNDVTSSSSHDYTLHSEDDHALAVGDAIEAQRQGTNSHFSQCRVQNVVDSTTVEVTAENSTDAPAASMEFVVKGSTDTDRQNVILITATINPSPRIEQFENSTGWDLANADSTGLFGANVDGEMVVRASKGKLEKEVVVGGNTLYPGSFEPKPQELYPFEQGITGALKGTEPIGYGSRTETAYGLFSDGDNLVTTLRDGTWIERATTNDITNPLFEGGGSDWFSTGSGPWTHDASQAGRFGDGVLYSTDPSNAGGENQDVSASGSTTHTLSLYIKNHWSDDIRVDLAEYDSSGNIISQDINDIQVGPTGGWERHTITITTDSNTATLRVRLIVDGARSGTCYVDAVQFEQQDVATSFVEGSRSGSGGITTAADMDPSGWAISFEVDMDWSRHTDFTRFLQLGATGTGNTDEIRVAPNDQKLNFYFYKNGVVFNKEGTTISGGTHRIVVRYVSGTYELWVDGSLYLSDSSSTLIDAAWGLHVGYRGTHGSKQVDAPFRAVGVWPELSGPDIERIAQAEAPIAPTPNRTIINRGNILTNAITADKIQADTTFTNKLLAQDATIEGTLTMGSGGEITNNNNDFLISEDGMYISSDDGGLPTRYNIGIDNIEGYLTGGLGDITLQAQNDNHLNLLSNDLATLSAGGNVHIESEGPVGISLSHFGRTIEIIDIGNDGVGLKFEDTRSSFPSDSAIEDVLGLFQAMIFAYDDGGGNINLGWAETDGNGNVSNTDSIF